jgi:hypothetical protein
MQDVTTQAIKKLQAQLQQYRLASQATLPAKVGNLPIVAAASEVDVVESPVQPPGAAAAPLAAKKAVHAPAAAVQAPAAEGDDQPWLVVGIPTVPR